MDIILLEREIVFILKQYGYNLEAISLENSEYGTIGGEIFGNIISNLIELKKNKKIYDIIQDKLDMILGYAKLIGRLNV